ncbi:hypothetical protein KQ875_00495 [Mycoplasma zalophi]|uniref:Lipoprotein n=1 Tax=Mycoplasma zalophi TaxID=191287 RepID=A0ABS6DP24_9MOLU|nr:hypothetical protein [Mycoplasma zalophi]MBU4692077.1 hypothetical protein [Mycoplasma zalophi]
MKKSLLLSLLSVSVLAPSTAIAAISCAPSDPLDLNERGKQETVLTSQQTKTLILQSVADNLISNIYSSEITTKTEDTIKTLYENKNSQFYKDFKKFFTVFARKQLDVNGQFFVTLRQNLLNNNVDVTNFTPVGWEMPTDEQMDFLFNNSTKLSQSIRLEIEKMIIVYNYLLQNRQEVLSITRDEKNNDKSLLKVDISKFTDENKRRFNSLDKTSKDVYLIKYLLDNKLAESWSFERTENVQLLQGHALINNVDTYNALIQNNNLKYKVIDDQTLLVNGSDNIDLTKLRGHNGVHKYTGSSTGDMNYDNYSLETKDYTVEGFVNPFNNGIYSVKQLTFNASVLDKLKAKPVISLKEESKQKTSFEVEDFNVAEFTYNADTKTFTRTIDNTTFNFKLTRIESTSDGNNIRLTVELSVPELGNKAKYVFSTELRNKNQTEARQFDPFDLPKFVDFYNPNSKHIEGKYIIKIAPRMVKKESSETQKETQYVSTLENTPWSTNEQKDKIALNIVFLDYPILYKTVVKYFNEQGVGIDTNGMEKLIVDFLKAEDLI